MFLNDSTRKFASWDVSVSQPRIEEYTYTLENKPRTAKNFRCVLVFVHDHTQYCLAEVRKAKGDPADIIQRAIDKYNDGLRFRMSHVGLNGNAKLEYINAPCNVIVNLSSTTMTKLMQTGTSIAPQPSITCAECLDFQRVQAFDITALVDSHSEKRLVLGRRHVRDIYLIDGSLSPTPHSGVEPPTTQPELIRLKCKLFYDAKSNIGGDDPEFLKTLFEATRKPQAF